MLMSERVIVGLTGMPASGKGYIAKRLVELGCESYSVGTTIKDYAAQHKLPLACRSDSANAFRDIFRKNPMALANPALLAGGDVVVDSLRVPAHADVIRRHAERHQARFVLLAAVCDSDQVRFERALADLEGRGSRDPLTFEAFVAEGQPETYNSNPCEISVKTLTDQADYTIDTLVLDKSHTIEAVDAFWMTQH